MKEKIKMICVYCHLLWKRMWKTHKIFLIFLFLPFLLVVLTQLVKEDETAIQVAVYIEGVQEMEPESRSDSREDTGKTEEMDAAEAEREESTEKQLFLEELRRRLEEREGTLVFTFYDSEEAVKQEVAAARAECGYCIPADLLECMERGRYSKRIKSYESPQSSLQTICEEALFAEIFSLYEEETFGEQAAELVYGEIEKTEHGTSMADNEQKKDEMLSSEVTERNRLAMRAEELLEKYQYNGSTFQFSYEVYSGEMTAGDEAEQGKSGFVSVRGILALAIYICGLCGTMDTLEDEKRGRTVRLKNRFIFQLLTIYLPVFMMSAVTFVCLLLTEEMNGFGAELLKLLFYQAILLVYCLILKKICRKEERLAAAMPVLILCSIVVCPIFVDLSQFIPVLKVLEKAFPIAYYLG